MRAVVLALALACGGCAHDNARLAALQSLDEPSKDLLSKYRQFLTQLQVDRFLAQPDHEARAKYIDSLKIEQRIAHYPKAIQDAIWGQDVIGGMDKPAVLLTWGSPDYRQIDEGKADLGVEAERWGYYRGDAKYEVVIVNGFVTEVVEGRR